MSLVEHAKKEMELAGLYEKDADYGGLIPDAVMALIEAHAKQGHSGGSHMIALGIFNRLVNFKTLTPITSKPEEWLNRTDVSGGHPTWQNLRDPSVFSQDGGKTWYDIGDPTKENWPEGEKQ